MLNWLQKRWGGHSKTAPGLSTELSRGDAKKALKDAEESYSKTVANGEHVDELVEKLRIQREKNHFGYLIEQSMRGADHR